MLNSKRTDVKLLLLEISKSLGEKRNDRERIKFLSPKEGGGGAAYLRGGLIDDLRYYKEKFNADHPSPLPPSDEGLILCRLA